MIEHHTEYRADAIPPNAQAAVSAPAPHASDRAIQTLRALQNILSQFFITDHTEKIIPRKVDPESGWPVWGPCTRCGHSWRGRSHTKVPTQCARCHSPSWRLPFKPNDRATGWWKGKRGGGKAAPQPPAPPKPSDWEPAWMKSGKGMPKLELYGQPATLPPPPPLVVVPKPTYNDIVRVHAEALAQAPEPDIIITRDVETAQTLEIMYPPKEEPPVPEPSLSPETLDERAAKELGTTPEKINEYVREVMPPIQTDASRIRDFISQTPSTSPSQGDGFFNPPAADAKKAAFFAEPIDYRPRIVAVDDTLPPAPVAPKPSSPNAPVNSSSVDAVLAKLNKVSTDAVMEALKREPSSE